MDPRLYLRARAIRPPPLRFYRCLDSVMGRWGKVRCFRNPRPSLSLCLSSLSCTCTRRVALPTYQTISRRDMYRLAKLFSNGRLFGILRPYQKLPRRRRTRGRVLFFPFLLLPLPTADISSCKQMWKLGRRKCLRIPA